MSDETPTVADVTESVRDAYRLLYGYQKSVIQIVQAIKRRLLLENCWSWAGPSDRTLSRSDRCPFAEPANFADMLPLLYGHFFYTNESHKKDIQVGDYCVLISHFADSAFLSEDAGIASDIEINKLAKADYEAGEPTLHVSLIAVRDVSGSIRWSQVENDEKIFDDQTPFEDWSYYRKESDLGAGKYDFISAGEYHSISGKLSFGTKDQESFSGELDARILVTPTGQLSSESEVSAFLTRLEKNLSEMSEKYRKRSG